MPKMPISTETPRSRQTRGLRAHVVKRVAETAERVEQARAMWFSAPDMSVRAIAVKFRVGVRTLYDHLGPRT